MKRLWLLLSLITFAGAECVKIEALYSDDYRRCLEKALGSADALACIEAEIAYQDKRLNEAYKEAKSRIQPFRRDTLRDIQRLWLRYRDAKCGFYRHKESGSGGVSDMSQCILDETVKRTVELKFSTY
ncbi:lysozyme inhibitor LprI family protein [Hydrogenimonas sp.]